MTPDATGVDAVIDGVTAVLLVVGALMSLGAAIGLLRFPDLMSRMHAATKPQVLGLFLMLAAIGLQMRTMVGVAGAVGRLDLPAADRAGLRTYGGPRGYRTKHLHRELLTKELEAVSASASSGPDGNPDDAAAPGCLDDVLGLGEPGDGALGTPACENLDERAHERRNQREGQG